MSTHCFQQSGSTPGGGLFPDFEQAIDEGGAYHRGAYPDIKSETLDFLPNEPVPDDQPMKTYMELYGSVSCSCGALSPQAKSPHFPPNNLDMLYFPTFIDSLDCDTILDGVKVKNEEGVLEKLAFLENVQSPKAVNLSKVSPKLCSPAKPLSSRPPKRKAEDMNVVVKSEDNVAKPPPKKSGKRSTLQLQSDYEEKRAAIWLATYGRLRAPQACRFFGLKENFARTVNNYKAEYLGKKRRDKFDELGFDANGKTVPPLVQQLGNSWQRFSQK